MPIVSNIVLLRTVGNKDISSCYVKNHFLSIKNLRDKILSLILYKIIVVKYGLISREITKSKSRSKIWARWI